MGQAIIDPVKSFYRNRIIIASIITVSFLVVAIFAVKNGLGFGNKKAWDWLDVLVFPVVLAVGALWYEKQNNCAIDCYEWRLYEFQRG